MELVGKTFTVAAAKPRREEHPVYAKVFNGKVWAVTREDFPGGDGLSLSQIRSRLISAGRHRGFRIESHIRDARTIEVRAEAPRQQLRKAG
jgi:hypothetical protein